MITNPGRRTRADTNNSGQSKNSIGRRTDTRPVEAEILL